ncbi:MAG: hypothetical protein ACTHQE_04795 [Thermomicrobiales bacterium]
MTDRDSAAASPASPARIPTPEGGLGSHELEIDSDDPVVLRQVLQRAKERLAFYESFDRIIGENVKRSGELMLETIALREEAQAAEAARLAREAEVDRDRQVERARTKALLTDLQAEIAGFRASADALAARAADALRQLEPDASPADESGAVTSAPDTVPPAAIPPVAEPARPAVVDAALATETATTPALKTAFRPIRHEPAPLKTEPDDLTDDDEPSTPPPAEAERQTIDIVVNGISRATTALAFQRTLTALAGVQKVETREFAEGILRLRAEVAGDDALSDGVFATWSGPGQVAVTTRQPTLIALDLSED